MNTEIMLNRKSIWLNLWLPRLRKVLLLASMIYRQLYIPELFESFQIHNLKGIWQQKIFLAHLKQLLKSFIKLFYSFYISRLVFEILRLEERKKSVKSAILDIHGYARFTSQQGSRDFFFFNQTLL